MGSLTAAIFYLAITALVSGQGTVERNTTAGKILGNNLITVETYLGIPYAAPPVGELRWKPPQPHSGWDDVLDATKMRSFCPQFTTTTPATIVGDEDCLHMNIYVPTASTGEKYPVMVFIHSGGFYFLHANLFDGSVLASFGKVIVVVFNYRLGTLGFMNTGDGELNGNYGMLDQIAALQWIRENIGNFGGDKDRVTLFGESAGSVSVLMQAMSPLNHDDPQLFHRVIAQSGTPFTWWAFQSEPRYYALQFMEEAGCPTYPTSEGVQCLRNMTWQEILQQQGWVEKWVEQGIDPPWIPSIDGEFITDIPDMMASSPDIINAMKGRYDFLVGLNEFDFLAPILPFVKNVTNEFEFKIYLQFALKRYFKDIEKIVDAVYYNYIDASNPPTSSEEWQRILLDITRDYVYLAPSVNISVIASDEEGYNSSTYFYLAVHNPSDAMVAAGIAFPDDPLIDGLMHAEELPYVFGFPNVLPTATQTDKEFSFVMMAYWTNFAKTGDPNSDGPISSEWPKFNWETQKYMVLGAKQPGDNYTRVKDHLESNKVIFWTKELELYGEGKGLDNSVSITPSPETTTTAIETTTAEEGATTAEEESTTEKSTTRISDQVSTTAESGNEIPRIARGLGLSLSPQEADTAIYAMFSMCVILGVALIVVLLLWIIKSRQYK